MPPRLRFVTLLAAAVVGVTAASLQAWGLDVHRVLTRRAMLGLPEPIRPFFEPHVDFIAEHSVDPDLWRVVGLESARGDEPANHFLDLDGLDEPPPFTRVPRTWDAYVSRYGAESANRMGRLPWRVTDVYRQLVDTFRDVGSNAHPYAADNARYLTAVLAHYVEDAHVPFHAVVNYDGQLTGQRGIHSRFETELVRRRLPSYRLAPVEIDEVPDVTAFVFDRLVEGQALVERILEADRRARGSRDRYDDAYFDAFGADVDDLVARRLGEAASGVASVIVAAWHDAGRPDLVRRGPASSGRPRR